MSDNDPPPTLKIVPDGQPVVSRHDTLNMEEAFAKIAPLPPAPPPCPTGFGRPRRRR